LAGKRARGEAMQQIVVKARETQEFRLQERFLEPYRRARDPFESILSRSTYLTKYCRNEESWTDTIRRVVEGNVSLAPSPCRAEAERLFELFWTCQALPPGRGLWTGGVPGIPANARFNCFSGGTRFWANGVLATLEEAVGETVEVLTKDGQWRPAKVRSFGRQRLLRYRMKPTGLRSSFAFEFTATAEHRWFTSNRGEVTDLRVGDQILVTPACAKELEGCDPKTFNDGFAHGLIFGDGSRETLKLSTFRLRLCGKKVAHRERLERASFFSYTCTPPSQDGEPVLFFKSVEDLKSLPPTRLDTVYQAGFLAGLLAADGSLRPGKPSNRLSSQNSAALDWVAERAPLLGYCVTGRSTDPSTETNYGIRSGRLEILTVVPEPTRYTVREIVDEGQEEEVFCVTEPETGSFTLEGGVVTGNCWFVQLSGVDDWVWTSEQLMLGGGVGVGLDNIGALPPVAPGNPRLFIECRLDHPNYTEVSKYSGEMLNGSTHRYDVEDSREGWMKALGEVLLSAFQGVDVVIDVSRVRPRGTPIRTFGGVAGGPGPLTHMLRSCWEVVRRARGRRLSSIDCLDVTNYIGLCVKAGNVRRCLPEGSLVHTKNGLKPIEAVAVGDEVLTGGSKFAKVSEHVHQGVQALYELTTQMGVFRCTGNHRVAVLTAPGRYEFKEAKELEPGDRMVFVDAILPGRPTELPSWSYDKPKHSTTCVDITVPRLDEQSAWFLGYFQGDGYTRANRRDDGFNAYVSVVVANDGYHNAIANRCREQLTRYGVRLNERPPRALDDCLRIRAQSKQLAWYLDDNLKKPRQPLNVPSFILEGLPHVRASYLAGLLDADGAARNRPVVLCASVYPSFLEQVQAVYASLGIPTRLKLNRSARGSWQPMYHLNLVGRTATARFLELVQPHATKRVRVSAVSQCDYGYPSEMVRAEHSTTFWKGRWDSTSKQMVFPLYEELGGEAQGLVPICVQDVTETDETADTYDIEVAGAEEFVCNGLLVHNSALMTLGSPTDQAFRNAKKDLSLVTLHRHTSNNSLAFQSREELEGFDWRQLVSDIVAEPGGEPGVFNLPLCRETDPGIVGINPCLTGDTRVVTQWGLIPIRDLKDAKAFQVTTDARVGTDRTNVSPGAVHREAEAAFQTSASEKVYRMRTRHGNEIKATAYHRFPTPDGFVELKDLSPGDTLLLQSGEGLWGADGSEALGHVIGWLEGDGCWSEDGKRAHLFFWDAKRKMSGQYLAWCHEVAASVAPRNGHLKRFGCQVYDRYEDICSSLLSRALAEVGYREKGSVPEVVWRGTKKCVRGYLRGLFATDGQINWTAEKQTFSVRLSQSNPALLRDVQTLLLNFGIVSSVYKRRDAGYRRLPDGKGDLADYWCKTQYDLVVSKANAVRFYEQLGFLREDMEDRYLSWRSSWKRGPYAERFTTEIVSIEPIGHEPVFCLKQPTHETFIADGVATGNCGELPLYNREACNLSEVFPSRFHDTTDADEVFRLVTRYCFRNRLSKLTDPISNAVQQQNMRLGVGLGGICDFDWTPAQLDAWYGACRREATRYAIELGTAIPKTVTTVKPSGTISLLSRSSPGIHAPFARHYIRRVRLDIADNLAGALMEAGVPHELDVYDQTGNTIVFSFAESTPAGRVTAQTQTLRQQFERQAAVQEHWADNAVSATITFDADTEQEELAALLGEFVPRLKSTTCLPKAHGYAQPPYEAIDRETFERLASNIDHDHPLVNGGEMEIEEACASGSCPIR